MSGAANNAAGGARRGEAEKRELPEQIDIPYINGEMVHLRPATIADLPRMDELQAFYNSTGITGKGPVAERAVVNAWVRRSVSWSKGQAQRESGVGDPESRRTIAWAMISEADHDKDGSSDASQTGGLIGMIFLIDIDGWSRSARIQVVLGKDYRGRGYSRDAMPRVMTYGYAAQPVGLGLHRIWVAVPEKNTRSISVYQSLGFMVSGTARDALWDEEGGKYQDQVVMDALVDEYDPIRSLDAFGMHVVEGNPGVAEALENHERTAFSDEQPASERAIADAEESERKVVQSAQPVQSAQSDSSAAQVAPESVETSALEQAVSEHVQEVSTDEIPIETAQEETNDHPAEPVETAAPDSATTWAYSDSSQKQGSKRAWWRNWGNGGKRNSGGNS
ncbi:acetyltransferase [Bombiscardovia apis]|uniref:Acetyltransferase n=1 Tax=Bombiscardovia apis TaxID=2932182 RepID=A0ABM8BAT3_9BIFI|nr:GNAT family N-acetyltransferase [Bombiscardovia apis]BDR54024.1 acetyltransferase [Bombiscardovia apis]